MKNISFNELFNATVNLVKADFGAIFLFMALLIGCWIAADVMIAQPAISGVLSLVAVAISVIGQSILTRRLLVKAGAVSETAMHDGRYPAVFGLVMLTGLGIFAGFILLIIPGIILLVRWYMSVPAMLTENLSVTEGIKASWHSARPHFWPIFLLILMTGIPLILAAIFYAIWGSVEDVVPLPESIIGNSGIALTTVLGWVGATACYTTINGGQNRISEIFG